jgi:hypothetical protein
MGWILGMNRNGIFTWRWTRAIASKSAGSCGEREEEEEEEEEDGSLLTG